MKNPAPARSAIAVLFSALFAALSPTATVAQEIGRAAGESARPKVALVLSGGSAFGMAHVGVIQVLEEAGIPIDMVMGTSMGSIVAGLYAAGYSPARMKDIVTRMEWNSVFNDGQATAEDRYECEKRAGYAAQIAFDPSGFVIGEGIFTGQNILTLFSLLTLHTLHLHDFDSFPVPYRAVAADIWNGEKIVFSKGSLAEAMRSSMSIPGVFKPYAVDGHHVVDGGIVDNMPTGLARDMGADIVIAVESRGAGPKSPESLDSLLTIAGHTLGLFIEQNMAPSREKADLLIVPDLSMYTTASYGEAAGIVAQGEKGGRAAWAAIEGLAEKIGKTRPLVRPDDQPNRKAMREPPLISSIRISGGNEEQDEYAARQFSAFIGSVPDREALGRTVSAVSAHGEFGLVKIGLSPNPDGSAELIITLVPAEIDRNALLLNCDVGAVLSLNSSVGTALSAGVLFRGWTTKNSAAFFKASLASGFGLYGEFFQPFGPFFAMPWLRFKLDYDEWIIDDLKLSPLYRSYGGGLWLGAALGGHCDFRIGASFEIAKDGSRSLTPADEKLAVLRSSFHWDNRSSVVFPEHGFSLLIYGGLADPAIGSQIGYAQVEIDFEAVFSLGANLNLGVTAFAGTDFAGFIPGAAAVDSSRYFRLARQGMFYGLNGNETQGKGDSVAGIGLELRKKIGLLNPVLGGDVFLVANASLGTADWYGESLVDFLPLRYSATFGLGLRLGDELGVFGGAGVVGLSGKIRPAVTLMIGSFEDKPEDRR